MRSISIILVGLMCLTAVGCRSNDCGNGCGAGGGLGGGRGGGGNRGPDFDRPFPLGQVSDSFWETQQTNAEAADFVFYDHEFQGNTALLAPGAKKKLMQVALRLEHVPFPVVIEESMHNARPQLDLARRRTIVEQLARMGVVNSEKRVVVAAAFAEGITATEGEAAYYQTINDNNYSNRSFGGSSSRGTFR